MGSLEDLPGPENEFGSLIPIKLDLEIEGKRLKEVFVKWRLFHKTLHLRNHLAKVL